MNYSLIRLRFDGLAHFGTSDSALSLFTSEDHFYADTLFSALCHTDPSNKRCFITCLYLINHIANWIR